MGLGKEFGLISTTMGRSIKQGSAITERLKLKVLPRKLLLRILRITPLHLKDPIIFWEKNKVCYCSQGDDKWNDLSGSHGPG